MIPLLLCMFLVSHCFFFYFNMYNLFNRFFILWIISVLLIAWKFVQFSVAENMKKRVSVRRRQSQLRQAKAYVISVLGEFAQTCWSKQVINFKHTWIKSYKYICVSIINKIGEKIMFCYWIGGMQHICHVNFLQI